MLNFNSAKVFTYKIYIWTGVPFAWEFPRRSTHFAPPALGCNSLVKAQVVGKLGFMGALDEQPGMVAPDPVSGSWGNQFKFEDMVQQGPTNMHSKKLDPDP